MFRLATQGLNLKIPLLSTLTMIMMAKLNAYLAVVSLVKRDVWTSGSSARSAGSGVRVTALAAHRMLVLFLTYTLTVKICPERSLSFHIVH
jgi:hypothetical protein